MGDRFPVIVRLLWIDEVIHEDGQIGRADIMRAFGISVAKASFDLRRYQQLNPGRIAYDPSGKTYMRVDGSFPFYQRRARMAAVEIVNHVAEIRAMREAATGATHG